MSIRCTLLNSARQGGKNHLVTDRCAELDALKQQFIRANAAGTYGTGVCTHRAKRLSRQQLYQPDPYTRDTAQSVHKQKRTGIIKKNNKRRMRAAARTVHDPLSLTHVGQSIFQVT